MAHVVEVVARREHDGCGVVLGRCGRGCRRGVGVVENTGFIEEPVVARPGGRDDVHVVHCCAAEVPGDVVEHVGCNGVGHEGFGDGGCYALDGGGGCGLCDLDWEAAGFGGDDGAGLGRHFREGVKSISFWYGGRDGKEVDEMENTCIDVIWCRLIKVGVEKKGANSELVVNLESRS